MAPVVSDVNKFRIPVELGSLFEQVEVCYGNLGISHCTPAQYSSLRLGL